MKNVEIRVQDLVDKLRIKDYRITPQRLAILKTLASTRAHPSVEQIFDKVKVDFPTTSIATVYKTVSLLKDMGELIEFSFGEGSNHYDGRSAVPHPHFICTSCRKIEDIDVPDLEMITEKLAEKENYQITAFQLNFYGKCPDCNR
ncbi:MAG: transcriptional repressor [Deltaproteobacteria bacterium]|nr:transcriptional repressor [Deltaproteobacteria bacterium]